MENSALDKNNESSAAALSLEDLCGVMLPCPTPFDSTAELNLPALRGNLLKWNTTGVKGYAVLGSTGERVHLDTAEYCRAIETAREVIENSDRTLTLIAGAGQQSTRGTVHEVSMAADMGADAVLVLTPHYYRSAITQDALVGHYTTVADSSPVPVILYSMPALTGIKIEPETIAALSSHPNIIGVKDSSADVDNLRKTVRLVNDSRRNGTRDFAVLTGNGTVLCDALLVGAVGGILAVGCVAPQLCIEIFRAVKAGENEHAARLQERLTPLAEAVTAKYGIGGLKAALDFIGYVGGPVRAPLRSPDEAARAEILRLLQEAQAFLKSATIPTGLASSSI